MAKLNADVREIMDMHSWHRPRGSATEQAFVDTYLTPLGFLRDKYQNLVLTIPHANGIRPRVLFSSHVDTVGKTGGRKTLHYDGQMLALSKRAVAEGFECLGADDTAGIWLMCQMVRRGVPGVYVVHHGEESGCIGSGDLAAGNRAFFDGIDMAVAFDRAGYRDVITHQMGARCCSDDFATALADALGNGFEPDDGGVYTDTNEYIALVPECTNISVGYRHQHSTRELQDVPFLIDLRDRLLLVDWSALPVRRDPAANDGRSTAYSGGRSVSIGYDEVRDLADLLTEYPHDLAEILLSYGINREMLVDDLYESTGIVPV